ncbi:hypothetical protein LTR53_015931 [Teratosphaeriaceae sp. CCFEE 6253]|nr:hypothetical protein LTR53_015931 [Teratosphaeriaceae sp. CCFEE 6253]
MFSALPLCAGGKALPGTVMATLSRWSREQHLRAPGEQHEQQRLRASAPAPRDDDDDDDDEQQQQAVAGVGPCCPARGHPAPLPPPPPPVPVPAPLGAETLRLAAQYFALVRRNAEKGFRGPRRPHTPRDSPITEGFLALPALPPPVTVLRPGDADLADPATTTTTTTSTAATPPEIPADLLELARVIRGLPRNTMGRSSAHAYPSRNTLRQCAALRGEVSRKTGVLRVARRGGRLRGWAGDGRLFGEGMWMYLCGGEGVAGEGAGAGAGAEGEGPGAEGEGPRQDRVAAQKRKRVGAEGGLEKAATPAKRRKAPPRVEVEEASATGEAGASRRDSGVGIAAAGVAPGGAGLSISERVKLGGARRCVGRA